MATLANLIEDATSYPNTDHGSNHTQTNTTMMMSMMWRLSKSGTGSQVDIGANFVHCLWPKDWISFIRALPLILFAFSCQVNVCAIYDELPMESDSNKPTATLTNGEAHDDDLAHTSNGDITSDDINHGETAGLLVARKDERFSHHQLSHKVQEQQVAMFRRVSQAAVAICAFLYASIAMVGVANFGRNVLPNILSNYHVPINAMMQVAFAGTALAVIMAFPLNVFPVRITLRELFCTRQSTMNHGDIMSTPYEKGDEILPSSSTTTHENDLGQPLLPQPQEPPVLSLDHSEIPTWLEEARAGAALIERAVQPPILFIEEEQERDQSSWGAHFVLTASIAGSALGIALILPNISVVFGLLGGSTTSILGFVIPGFLGLAALDKKNDDSEGGELSSSLSIQRWHCWILVVGGAIIGVVTTGVTIYSYTS